MPALKPARMVRQRVPDECDVVLTSPEIVEMLPPTDAKIVTTTNMLNKDEVTGLLVNCVKENFPGEM